MTALHELSVHGLATRLREGATTAVAIAEDCLDRIAAREAAVGAWQHIDREAALAMAARRDTVEPKSRLHGIPLGLKDIIDTADMPTTYGSPIYAGHRPTEDAICVQRLRAAGAVILGKTNVPIGLADWQSYNDIYGVTGNPFDVKRTPGGSSGGSSAALAAGYGPLSLGSDIGGSLRAPAHFCGVYAHKPTYALVPSRGHTPPPFPPLPVDRDLAVVGPMAISAGDLADLLDVIAGPDELAGGAYRLALPEARHKGIKGFRILVLDTHPLMPAAASVRGPIDALASQLAKAGAKVSRQSPLLPDLNESSRLYMRLLFSFLAATFPIESYEGMKAGAARLDADDRSLDAERLRGAALSHRDWVMCDSQRAALRARWRAFFREFDAVLCPIMPTPAYVQDHQPDQNQRRVNVDGKDYPYVDQLVWPGIATCPGLPATAIPIGRSPEGLPVGAQIVGPWLEDRTPLRLAELIEKEFAGGFVPPPGFA
jgi:amidase